MRNTLLYSSVMTPLITGTNVSIFLLLLTGTALFEVLVSKLHYAYSGKRLRKYHFSFARYLLILIPPFVAVRYLFVTEDIKGSFIKIFIAFALIGTLLEWLIGFLYRNIIGNRHWSYHRYSIGGYTSILVIPYWGFVGILAYLLIRVLQ